MKKLSPIIVTREGKDFIVQYRHRAETMPLYIYRGNLEFEYAKLIRLKHTPNNTTHYGIAIINKITSFKNIPIVWLTTQTEEA